MPACRQERAPATPRLRMAGIRGGPATKVLPPHRQGARAAHRAQRLLARYQPHGPGTGTVNPMNKVTTVNLNGRAFQVEEQAYELLRAYLDEAARLLADDPDYREIMADLEQAIGDKGARHLRSGKNVLAAAEMKRILEEMGPVETGEGIMNAAPEAGAETSDPKRLDLIREGIGRAS